jgi:glycosyltransferase involved in cell wall biosynthesis
MEINKKKKKILWLGDDCRFTSGIATMTREIFVGLIKYYDFAQIAGSGKHPEEGKIIDMSEAFKAETGVKDAYCMLYPVTGYGNPDLLKQIIQREKPDCIVHFTDPRFWIWLYQMEHEIRQHVPIIYYTIWDSTPYPMFNHAYYRSCDALLAISRQTENICKNVLGEGKWVDLKEAEESQHLNGKSLIHYVPHGVNPKVFKPLYSLDDVEKLNKKKKELFGEKDYKFVLFYNNRNIQRKRTSNIILGYRMFLDSLPKEQRDQCVLLMHTPPVDEAGTDLIAVQDALCPDGNIVFSINKISPEELNLMYNIADVTVSATSNEGWGICTTESIMAGTVTIMPVTGGQQDQIGQTDESGVQLQFSPEWGSNADGRYKTHGVWTKPLYPTNRTLQGSPPTPYIFDDLTDWKDIGEAMYYWYSIPKEKRDFAGKAGRKWALAEGGMSSENMCLQMKKCIDLTLAKWRPREKYSVITEKDYVGNKMHDSKHMGFLIPNVNKNKIEVEVSIFEEKLKEFS